MALVARMVAQEVTARHGTIWTPTAGDDPAGKTPDEAFANYTYGVPFWLRDYDYIRADAGKGQEDFKLECVRSGGPDDPNNEFFVASPHGGLQMSIENPAGFGYVVAGESYRITIEKIRGPRS
jgi:hypothetical protein